MVFIVVHGGAFLGSENFSAVVVVSRVIIMVDRELIFLNSRSTVMVSRLVPPLLITILLPTCSSSLRYTTTNNDNNYKGGIHFPVTAFLASSRKRQRQIMGVRGDDDVPSVLFGRKSSFVLLDKQHQCPQSLSSLNSVGGARIKGTSCKSTTLQSFAAGEIQTT